METSSSDDIARSSNGRTTVSGTVYLGSSPSLATRNNKKIKAQLWSFYYRGFKMFGRIITCQKM